MARTSVIIVRPPRYPRDADANYGTGFVSRPHEAQPTGHSEGNSGFPKNISTFHGASTQSCQSIRDGTTSLEQEARDRKMGVWR